MKEKQQVMHIHGGEPDVGYQEYLTRLKTGRFEPTVEDSQKWYRNLRIFLEPEKFEVITPTMPNSENAHYSEWKIWFERHIPFLRDDIILVGHSLGGNFLAKYLAEEGFKLRIKQLHLVAPSYDFMEDDFNIESFPGKILEKNIAEIHIYHSKDDTVVPISESEKYHVTLPGLHFHVFEDRFHFIDETFPELFNIIKKA